MVTEEEKY